MAQPSAPSAGIASRPPGTAPCGECSQPVIGMLNTASRGAALSKVVPVRWNIAGCARTALSCSRPPSARVFASTVAPRARSRHTAGSVHRTDGQDSGGSRSPTQDDSGLGWLLPMPSTVPAPFEALFAGSSEGDRAAVDLLCRLVDASSDVLLEVNGRRVPLPASLRTLLQRAVDHLRRGDDIRRSLGRAPARTLLQPVVHLGTAETAGYEALSDLSTRDLQGADSWFRDAAVLRSE